MFKKEVCKANRAAKRFDLTFDLQLLTNMLTVRKLMDVESSWMLSEPERPKVGCQGV